MTTPVWRVVSARTTNPNTPESDLLPEVMHTVYLFSEEHGQRTVDLLASDPLNAIDKVNQKLREGGQP